MAHMQQDHLTPAQVGLLAAQAKVKRVVLTHVVPGMDGEAGTTAGYVAGIAERHQGPVTGARDLDRF